VRRINSYELEVLAVIADHVGPMEITKKRYNHIPVVVDAFSKYVWLYPTRSTGVEEGQAGYHLIHSGSFPGHDWYIHVKFSNGLTILSLEHKSTPSQAVNRRRHAYS